MSKAGVAQRDGAAAAKTVAEVKRRKRVEIVKITVWRIADRQPEEFDAKECTVCGVTKSTSDFNKQKYGTGGFRSNCRVCQREEYKANKDRYSEMQRSYYAANREAIADYGKIYRERNKDRIKKYKADNRETRAAQCREWYKRNREYALEYAKDYTQRNSEEIRARTAKYREVNKVKIAKNKHNYKINNRDKSRYWESKRRARKLALPDVFTNDGWEKFFSDFNGMCALTNVETGLHAEHFIAISIGHGGTYSGNMYPMCESLNLRKWKFNPFEWIRTHPEIDANRFDAVVAYLADLNGLTIDEYRQFVDWCYANPRTIDEIKRDNARYGFTVSSIELWREATGIALPLRIDFRPMAESEREVSAM